MHIKASSLLCLLLLCLKCCGEDDPTKVDFCKFEGDDCVKGEKDANGKGHPACACESLSDRTEVYADDTDKLTKFRQDVLDIHNKLRNDFAGGKEDKRGFGYAADMMAVKYDLMLEYIARCRAMGSLFSKDGAPSHENCRRMPDGSFYGQNLHGGTGEVKTTADVEIAIAMWYNEIGNVDDVSVMDSYRSVSKMIGHFSELIWSRITHIGCVLVHMPNSVSNVFKYVILCNYHGGQSGTGNMIGEAVYKRVDSVEKTCTACYDGTKCGANSKYPYLCGGGEVKDAPKDKPPVKDGCSERSGSKMIIIVMIFIIIGFY